MDERYDRRARQFTSVTLAAAGALIGPAYLGVGPSIPLGVAAAVLAGLLFSARDSLADAVSRESLIYHARTLWIGPALAAVVIVLVGSIRPEELQTVGAVIGLVGMANYLIRPVYLFVAATVQRLVAV